MVDSRRPSPDKPADSEQSDLASPGPCGSSTEPTVTLSHEFISKGLEDVRDDWSRTGDEKAFRRALLDLLRQLEDFR